jgi:hypothetical protein
MFHMKYSLYTIVLIVGFSGSILLAEELSDLQFKEPNISVLVERVKQAPEDKKVTVALELSKLAGSGKHWHNPSGGASLPGVLPRLNALLKSIEVIESLQIKDYDFERPFERRVSFPGIEPGTDPRVIEDATTRSNYQAALDRHRNEIRIRNEQRELDLAKLSNSASVKVIIRNNSHNEESLRLLKETIKQSGVSKEVKEFLEECIQRELRTH